MRAPTVALRFRRIPFLGHAYDARADFQRWASANGDIIRLVAAVRTSIIPLAL
jgi:hypothetical protein